MTARLHPQKEIVSLKQELAGAGREVSEAGQREAGDQGKQISQNTY